MILENLSDLAHQDVKQIHHDASSICSNNRLSKIKLEGALGLLTFLGNKTHLTKKSHGNRGIATARSSTDLEGYLLLHDLRNEDWKGDVPCGTINKCGLKHRVIDDRWDFYDLAIKNGINNIRHVDCQLIAIGGREGCLVKLCED